VKNNVQSTETDPAGKVQRRQQLPSPGKRRKFKSNWNARQLLPKDAAIQFSFLRISLFYFIPGCVLPLGAVLNEWTGRRMRPCRKGFASFVPVVNGHEDFVSLFV
jgi:hypothetical protein